MQGACQVAGVTTEKLGHKGITGTQYPPIAVKQEDDGALRAVVDIEVLNVVDIDIDCTRQLQNELYEECLCCFKLTFDLSFSPYSKGN